MEINTLAQERLSHMVANDPVFQKEFRVAQRWPGALGKVATHVVVFARLLIDGKDYGVHAFIVQVRSLEDHQPLSGVIVGDIGLKFGNGGYNTMDNGFLRFNNVHIPRDHMLMRMDGYREEGSSSQDRQSIPIVHEVGESSSQAEEGFPHAACVAGSILVQNGSLKDLLDDSYKVLVKHLKNDNEHGKQSSVDSNLLAQLNRLRQELNSLASERSSSITVVSGSSRTNGSIFSYAVPALVIGVTGYGYMRWKGITFSDFMYVTRRRMSDAVSSVSKQLEQVSTALQATKRHLTSRLERLSGNLDQNMELQEELKNEVSLVRGDVEKYGLEIETVQRLVQTLGVKIDTIENKQDMANMGVIYLCNFVEKTQISQPPEAVQGLHKPRLERGRASTGSIGFKDLQSISNALESGDAHTESPASRGNSEIATISSTKSSSPSLQRRFPSLSAGLTSSFFSRSKPAIDEPVI
ncbi:hypothetical protein L7F22_064602 [Adiantum nelumboides]|nr:hypothetical protein [Adiantum nelumboides]